MVAVVKVRPRLDCCLRPVGLSDLGALEPNARTNPPTGRVPLRARFRRTRPMLKQPQDRDLAKVRDCSWTLSQREKLSNNEAEGSPKEVVMIDSLFSEVCNITKKHLACHWTDRSGPGRRLHGRAIQEGQGQGL